MFSPKCPPSSKDDIPLCYNHLFMEFLKNCGKWQDAQLVYEFGKNGLKTSTEKEMSNENIPIFLSSSPKEHNLKIIATDALLWETESEMAITAGNLLHETMAKIYTESDAEQVIQELKQRAIVLSEEYKVLKNTIGKIVGHPQLRHLFDGSAKVYNERDIITQDGNYMRPDRINVFSDNYVTIVDYKTGSIQEYHKNQLERYASALEEMGFGISEKILIYSNSGEILINKV